MSRSANDEHSETDPHWQQARSQLFGMIMEGRSFSGRERNCFFLNTGKQQFATISALSGLDFPDDGRCIAVTDWDRDGDQDLWISNRNAPRIRLMRNETPSDNHFVSFQLVGNGTTTNRDAIGARVEVVVSSDAADAPSPRLIKTLRAGEGFLSQSSKWLHFGLGQAASIERVTVHWPGGQAQEYDELQLDQRYRLSQGSTVALAVADIEASPAAVHSGEIELPAESRVARVVLETRVPMPSVRYAADAASVVTERFASGRPTLVNLWASWCHPCIEELADLTSNRQQLDAAGLHVIALSVDSIGQNPTSMHDVESVLQQIEYPFAWGPIDVPQMEQLQELHDQFFFLRRTLPLPSSFLVDADGRLSVIYRGPVTAEQVLSDAERAVDGDQDSVIQAACLPGRSLDHPRVREVAEHTARQTRHRVAAWLEASGQSRDALTHFGELAEEDPSWALPQRHLAKLHLDMNEMEAASLAAARALKLDPQNATGYITMGLIRSREGDQPSAESHFRESIRLDPSSAGAHNNLGIVLAMQRKLAAAGRCFQQAVQLDDDFAEAHANLGNVYAAGGDVQRAARHYQRAIEIDPSNVDPYNNLGTMFGRQGDIRKAIEYYQRALRVDPNHRDTRRNLDRALQLWNSRPKPAASE